jgi:dihydrofolate reductase
MPRVVYYCAVTLDGYVAEPDDTIDWLTSYRGTYAGRGVEPMAGSYASFYDGVGALVCGSATYEFVLESIARGGTWPYAGKPCWVFTSRQLPVPAGDAVDVRFAAGRVADVFDELIGSAGAGDLWIVGGGPVASEFADEGLLDEVHLHVVPVVLAAGKPLFARRLARPMQLLAVAPRDNGMVELRYAVTHG